AVYNKGNQKYPTSNPTFLYEAHLLENQQSDNQFKRKLADRFRNNISVPNLKSGVEGIDTLADKLAEYNIDDIITTNVDRGIEIILCEKNGYKELMPEDAGCDVSEKVYSVRRKIGLKRGRHELSIWKIHGDIDNIASMSLGFDQYCGSLAKLENYLKGMYYSSTGIECKKSIWKKCLENTSVNNGGSFDGISWVELFFNSNVYIAGFGLDFAEIDIWWLLNKRKRMIKQGIPIQNRIVYLYSSFDYVVSNVSEHLSEEDRHKNRLFDEKKTMLDIFGVECKEIEAGKRFISSIFEAIN
ncbi:MAG: hypothetical protein J5910_00900, partial [Lachnospiraceae bacterium]|nr:hypothetical protein [Lachnospiraceae bacterium]